MRLRHKRVPVKRTILVTLIYLGVFSAATTVALKLLTI